MSIVLGLVIGLLTLPATAHAVVAPIDCSTGTLSTAFGALPIEESIGTAGEVDCFPVPNVDGSDRLEVAFQGAGYWSIVDGAGIEICWGRQWWGSECQLAGSGGWRLLVYEAGEGAFAYSLAVRRLTDPQGCSSLGDPAVWSFTAPRLNGSLDGPLDARCYTFTRSAGEEDGSYWFRTMRTAGSLSPVWRVLGPSGARECMGSSSGYERCALLAAGQFTVVVGPSSTGGTEAGSFFLTAKRTTSPTGCSALPSVAFGVDPLEGSIGTAGEVDCFSLPDVETGDRLDVGLRGTGSWSIVDGTGEEVCRRTQWSGSSPCQLGGVGGWRLLVFDLGPATFAYGVAVRRLTDPQGCSSLGDPAVWSFTAPRLNGSLDGPLDARCYTFTRELGDEDGSYWFRTMRTAGSLSPYWRVFGPSGTGECTGSSDGYDRCQLLTVGQFTVVVAPGAGSDTDAGAFFLTAKRTTAPTGCSALPSIAFGVDPLETSIGTAGEIDCYALPDVEAGDRLDVGMRAAGSWSIVDGTGLEVCEGYGAWGGAECTLGGSGGWRLLVYEAGEGAFAYSLAVRRLTDPQGCSSLGDPAVWSFTAPRLNGSLDGPLDARCYTFTRGFGEEDGAYWFRTLRTSGTLSPYWRVLGPSGARECMGSSGGYERCGLLAAGQFTLVVGAGWAGGGEAGSFLLTSKRTTSPEGCATLPSIAFGVGPISGKLGNGGEIDCYAFSASDGDILSFDGSGAANAMAVVGADGTARCEWWQAHCALNGDGTFSLLVYATGTGTGSYSFQGTCENVPCGQSDTAVTDVFPSRVGPSVSTSVLLRGRDLDLLQSATLVRGSQTVEGDLHDPAPDGRATEALFDLSGAALGNWELHATFLDGTTRIVPDAVTVEALRPASVSVELIGREVFRAGRPASVTLELHNSGNVDGLAVPVVLSGIPAGSTVEPQFQMRAPQGTVDAPTLVPSAFDQSADTILLDNGIAVPLMLPRIPAGRSTQLEFRVTAPTQGTDYTLRAAVGQCLGAPAAERRQSPAFHEGSGSFAFTPACGDDFGRAVLGFVPFGDCASVGIDTAKLIWHGILYPMLDVPEEDPVGTVDGVSFGLSVAGCALDATGVGGVVKRVVQGAGLGTSLADMHDDCWIPQAESQLPQRMVAAFDPNDILGPAGAGENRYIPGDEPLGYQVLFENVPTATAPAQRVEIVDQLDTAIFDPATVLFQDIRFGSTVYSLPYESHELDETIDLRPAQDLLVHVTAAVTGGGEVRWELQAIDPETLAPPEDPLAGFLPPNVSSPEGEGHVSFTVRTKDLPSGAVVPNQASIRFDANDPIGTPVWTNAIDKQPPTATVSAQTTANPAAAEVAWGGSDDAAGIALWEIRVSRDGAPFAVWRTAAAAGSDTFVAEQPGTYSFRAIARDGAGNSGTSAQSAVTLGAKPPGPKQPTTKQPPGTSSTPKPTVDRSAPRIRLLKHPKARVRLVRKGGKGRKAKVSFAFAATEAGATFTCRLDTKAIRRCASPLVARVGRGRHVFRVFATDAAGNVGAVVTFRFRVLARR